MSGIVATAEVVRHAYGLVGVLAGLALLRWAGPIGRAYGRAFGWAGLGASRKRMEGGDGVVLIALVGTAFAGFGIYWMVVGTG